MTQPLTNADDLGPGYMAHRQASAQDDIIARARARLLASGEGVDAAAQTPAMTEAAMAPPSGPNQGAAVARDVGRGVVEAPRQAIGGISDAVHNAMRALDPIVEWLERNVAVLPRYEVEPVGEAATVTGGIVRDTARFLTGFIPALRGAKAIGITHKIAKPAVAGAASDAVTADPREDGLSNLVQQYPALQNPVTEFLAADPDDPDAIARLKKAAEGAGLGLLADGLVAGVRAIARARRAGATIDQAAKAMAEQRAQYGELSDRDFLILGDPNAPLLETKARPPANPQAKLDAANARIGQDMADSVIARLARTPFGEKPRAPFDPGKPVPLVAGAKPLTAHADYAAAKAGDAAAAKRVVADNVTDELVERIRTAAGEGATLAFFERPGGNAIARAFAEALGQRLGLPVAEFAIDSGAKRTGTAAAERMVNIGGFSGEVAPGGRYVVVDDFITLGGALADFRSFLIAQGADAAAVATLGKWRGFAGQGFEALTDAEAAYLARFGDPDGALTRLSDANVLRNVRGGEILNAIDEDAALDTLPKIGAGEARYTTRAGRRYVALDGGSDELGRIGDDVAAAIRREAAPIRLPEGSHDAATGKGHGELHIEARRGDELRALGYPDAASFVADVVRGHSEIRDAGQGRLLLVRRNGTTVAVVELQPTGESTFAAHWSVLSAGQYRSDFVDKKDLLWSRPGPDGSPPGGGSSFNPGGQASNVGSERVFINFARIASPDDVKRVMADMADAFAGDIDQARRGVQSNEETKRLADELGMSVADLLARRQGQPLNAEEAVAARRLWAASAEKLLDLAKRAADPNAGAIDQFNFRKMMAVHYAIQAEVIGARTETARALQAWKIPAGGGVEKARAVQTMLDQMGGPAFSKAMAQRLAMLAESGATPDAINAMVRKTWAASTVAAVQEAWVNALLSSPKTHMVNVMSNVGVAFHQIVERGVAARFAELTGGEVAPGEALAMTFGMIESLKDAFRLAALALRTGDTGASLGKVDLPRERAIQGDFLRESGHNGLAAAVDLIGEAARVPSRLLGAEDEFFKTIGYRMELYAQALRQAFAEGHRGEAMGRRMAEIVNDPPEHIRLSAADAALYNTFTNATGGLGRALLELREKVPLVVFILPFVRTPVNIARSAFERSPLAPLVGQWRDDIAAGGARAELAIARMGTGTAVMLLAADYADIGLISGGGPDDPGERENRENQGWKPYSIRIGDRWISYNRADPLGMTLGFAADLAELVKRRDIEPDELDEINEVVAAMIAAVSRTVVSKTYMQGLSDFVEMMADPERYGPDYINKLAGSFVPAGVAAVESLIDPATRETMTIGDSVLARLPVLSERLPPKRNRWGEPRQPDSGFGTAWDALSPVQVSKVKDSPADAEMQRLNLDVRRIAKKTNWGGVDINLRDWPEVYDTYVRLAGNELKHPAWELGAKDLIAAVVSGKHELSEAYAAMSEGEDGGKALWIKRTIAEFRQLARAAIEADPQFAAFAQELAGKTAAKQQKRMPAGVAAPALQ